MFNTNFDFTKNNPFAEAIEKQQAEATKFIEEHFAPVADAIEAQKEFVAKTQEIFAPIVDFNKEIIAANVEIQKNFTNEVISQAKAGYEVSKSVSEDFTSLVSETFKTAEVAATKAAAPKKAPAKKA